MPQLDSLHPIIEKIINNIEKLMVGKRKETILALTALLAEGHVLLEDVPGVGKTMLARTLSKSIDADYKRIQFTPDLLPSDVTGVSIYNPKELQFEFKPGPIMGNFVLADEINRTSPKTQSALLECMEEGNITIDGITNPFMPSLNIYIRYASRRICKLVSVLQYDSYRPLFTITSLLRFTGR
ncbi:MoxR-like ATPase [Bacillus cereus]|uniref:MoxR-like ATPase n=1 Tax=Bacillus cereus TaxID=1396 RepID=A0A161QUB4_BACCE|nr:MoxR-like ATPase [Bacillus cereus]